MCRLEKLLLGIGHFYLPQRNCSSGLPVGSGQFGVKRSVGVLHRTVARMQAEQPFSSPSYHRSSELGNSTSPPGE